MEKDMVVIRDVFDQITEFEWLEQAYKEARKQKRYRPEVLLFSADLDANLLEIQAEVRSGSFVFGPYRKHWVYVPKKRLVMALPFRSRIVQWAIYLVLSPYYEKKMIEDSYACRKNKGSLLAIQKLQYWLRLIGNKQGDWYCVKIDISKYFYRVNHRRLIEVLRRRIKDERLMKLLEQIINSDGEKFGLPKFTSAEEIEEDEWLDDVGMPIGNLTSQMFANIYLNELDQCCKHELKIRYYIRYMDDIVILVNGKDQAREYLRKIEKYLNDVLLLDLNKKTSIRPACMQIEFVGYIATANRLRLRKSTVRRIKRAFRSICERYFDGRMTEEEYRRRVASYDGMIKHCDNERLKYRLNEIYVNAKREHENKISQKAKAEERQKKNDDARTY